MPSVAGLLVLLVAEDCPFVALIVCLDVVAELPNGFKTHQIPP